MKKNEKKKKYESPFTKRTQVNLENGFMTASIFEKENGHDKGLTIEEHGFASTNDWEGDYSEDTWD